MLVKFPPISANAPGCILSIASIDCDCFDHMLVCPANGPHTFVGNMSERRHRLATSAGESLQAIVGSDRRCVDAGKSIIACSFRPRRQSVPTAGGTIAAARQTFRISHFQNLPRVHQLLYRRDAETARHRMHKRGPRIRGSLTAARRVERPGEPWAQNSQTAPTDEEDANPPKPMFNLSAFICLNLRLTWFSATYQRAHVVRVRMEPLFTLQNPIDAVPAFLTRLVSPHIRHTSPAPAPIPSPANFPSNSISRNYNYFPPVVTTTYTPTYSNSPLPP
jgi:hypothetical protein